MDFVVGLPRTRRQNDSIWIIMDRLTNPLTLSQTSLLIWQRIIQENTLMRLSLHGIPLFIISDRGAQYTSLFWRSFQKGLGTQVKFSTAFILKRMVRRRVLFKP